MIFVLEAVDEIKEQYFTVVNKEEGREPSPSLVSVTDGTARNIGCLQLVFVKVVQVHHF